MTVIKNFCQIISNYCIRIRPLNKFKIFGLFSLLTLLTMANQYNFITSGLIIVLALLSFFFSYNAIQETIANLDKHAINYELNWYLIIILTATPAILIIAGLLGLLQIINFS